MILDDNVSIISVFTLSGLGETMEYRTTLFSLTLLYYIVIIMVNVALILTIILDGNLHQPMYIFLCNLCISGLFGTAGFYPKFLLDLLSYHHVISYAGCLFQAFVIYSSACSDFAILSVMAYDRYVAICRPLEYHSVMTKQRVTQLAFYPWILTFSLFTIAVTITIQMKLCQTHIERLYCSNWSVVKLSCSLTIPDYIVGYIIILSSIGHFIFILCSYTYLVRLCLESIKDRVKFMQTCMPHLLSLFNVSLALLFDVLNNRYGSRNLPQSLQNFMAIEFLVVPPILNPVIYGLKLTQLRNRILRGFMNGKKLSMFQINDTG